MQHMKTKRLVVSVPEALMEHVQADMEADRLCGRRPSAAGSLVRLAAVGAARLAAEDAQSRVIDAFLDSHPSFSAEEYREATARASTAYAVTLRNMTAAVMNEDQRS